MSPFLYGLALVGAFGLGVFACIWALGKGIERGLRDN